MKETLLGSTKTKAVGSNKRIPTPQGKRNPRRQQQVIQTFTIKFLALSHDGTTMAPMKADRKDSRSSALERINLRLSPEVLEAIDAECSRRAGSVSRNTWITEAVTERLARLASSSRPQGAGGANG